jgi:hypothetical protein
MRLSRLLRHTARGRGGPCCKGIRYPLARRGLGSKVVEQKDQTLPFDGCKGYLRIDLDAAQNGMTAEKFPRHFLKGGQTKRQIGYVASRRKELPV